MFHWRTLLFNFFINDLIFFITTFLSNYADDNSLYNTGKDLELVKSVQGKDFRAVKEWFYENFRYADSSPTGHFPDWHFPEDKSPTDASLTETSPTDIFPNRQFPDRALPRRTLPRLDISPLGHFPERTFPRPDISLTTCFSEMFFFSNHFLFVCTRIY